MQENHRRIVIVAPVRDEETYIGGTIDSVIGQTLRPVELLFVDDGSKDATAEIVSRNAREHPWIRLERKPDRGARAVGPGVVETFYFGYERLQTAGYDYICKMDGDIVLPSRYFERLVGGYFEKDPYLGSGSGKSYIETPGGLVEERMGNEMVAGQVNFYRRKCFDDIGGFVRQVHWDGIAFHRARMKGWRTRSMHDPDLSFIHKRLMGSSHRGVMHGRLRWGRGQWFMGTHPLYLFAIGVYRMAERPFIVGGLGIIAGYYRAKFEGMKQYDDPEFRRSLRAWQLSRLGIGKRLEQIPSPPENLYS